MYEATGDPTVGVVVPLTSYEKEHPDYVPAFEVGPTNPDRFSLVGAARAADGDLWIGAQRLTALDIQTATVGGGCTDQKIKSAAGKPQLATIPMRALYGAARVFGYGSRKYAPGNFLHASLETDAAERYLSAAFRHLGDMQQLSGLFDDNLDARDTESGLPHVDHAITCLLMLRSILIKEGVLPVDPGIGNDPPKEIP